MSTLVVVDGHNVFNDAGRWLAKNAVCRDVQAYLRDWFDVDRLVAATVPGPRVDTHADLGIVVFRSKKALGGEKGAREPYMLKGDETDRFWIRQGSAPNTSTYLVEIPGAPSGKDAGMDTSIVVYLFTTSDRWERAILFTADSDFVPAVRALRERGKRVYCAGMDPSSPLAQACQSYFPWNVDFLAADAAMVDVLMPGGALDTFLRSEFGRTQATLNIQISGDALWIDGGYHEGNASNLMHESIRDAGRDQFVSVRQAEGGFFLQSIRRRAQGLDALLVWEGFRRHSELFSEAAWWKHYRAQA